MLEDNLSAGTKVRLKSDPGRLGILTGQFRQQGQTKKYQINFENGGSGFQPSYEIEEILEENPDWPTLLKEGNFGRVRDLRRNLTNIHLSGRLANLVYSMDATNIDFYAYQYKPVISLLGSPSNGLLIADEVGLGKTIEAGLIWTELRARFDARRLLIICPAMLREKWKSEMRKRFGVEAKIADANELVTHLKQPRSRTRDGEGFICSLQGIRPPKGWREGEDGRPGPQQDLARLLDKNMEEEPLFDLIIIDEAHYMRNPESQTAKLGLLLRNVADHIVLLSATPINLKSDDLFHLLKLVDPDTFNAREVFPQILEANEPLHKAGELCLNKNATSADVMAELTKAQNHELLSNNNQLNAIINTGLPKNFFHDKSDRIRLANKIERINLLKNSVTRTRKSQVTEWKVVREPVTVFVDIDQEGPEWKFYQSVTEAIRRLSLIHISEPTRRS